MLNIVENIVIIRQVLSYITVKVSYEESKGSQPL